MRALLFTETEQRASLSMTSNAVDYIGAHSLQSYNHFLLLYAAWKFSRSHIVLSSAYSYFALTFKDCIYSLVVPPG